MRTNTISVHGDPFFFKRKLKGIEQEAGGGGPRALIHLIFILVSFLFVSVELELRCVSSNVFTQVTHRRLVLKLEVSDLNCEMFAACFHPGHDVIEVGWTVIFVAFSDMVHHALFGF